MKKKISIHIGGFHASREPTVIDTLLGSCVAVCLYDPVASIGGMNHILLPGKADLKHFDNSARYATDAMELLIQKVISLGGKREHLGAKVFGGANVLPSISGANGVGTKNSEFILELLRMEAINVISHDLGGHDTRRIYFHTDTSEVLLKRIPCTHHPDISQEEKRLLES